MKFEFYSILYFKIPFSYADIHDRHFFPFIARHSRVLRI